MKRRNDSVILKERRIPYPVRLPEKDLKTLQENGIDIPEEMRQFVRDLARKVRGE